jgi:hypothetical protein
MPEKVQEKKQICKDCRQGEYRPGFTQITFDRVYPNKKRMGFRVANVPALICARCNHVLLDAQAEQRLWEDLREIENSKEFREVLEGKRRAPRHAPVNLGGSSARWAYRQQVQAGGR